MMETDVTTHSLVGREKIVRLEESMRAYIQDNGLEPAECPVTHHFAPGVYGREMLLPKDTVAVGKIHKHDHLVMIIKGHVSVATEDGVVEYHAPVVMSSKAGIKRVAYAHEDTIWVTIHVTNLTDLDEIEEYVIAKTYDEYDELETLRSTLCLG